MANPIVALDDRIAVRVSDIHAIEVSGESVIVFCDYAQPYVLHTRDEASARDRRNQILAAIMAADNRTDATSCRINAEGVMPKLLAQVASSGETASSVPPSGADYGLPQINQIVGLLKREFGDRLKTTGFRNDLWLALQVIYGSEGAARYANDCLNPLSRVM